MTDVQKAPLIVAGATIAVWLLRKIMPKLPKAALPWAAAALAVLANVAAPGGGVGMDEVQRGLLEGLAASGLWSGGAKHVLGGKKKEG